MRKVILALLLLVVISVPALAFSPRDSYLDTVAAIAWTEGRELNVALANSANTRSTVTISTRTLDSRGRTIFSSRQIDVPGRTIIVESFTPATPARGEELNVRVTEGYRSINVFVQASDVMQTEDYIVPANTDWEVSVDLSFLMQEPRGTRLVIDDFYETADGYNRGPIKVASFEGGLRHVRSTNSIEYAPPSMVLAMKTPQISGLTALGFGLRKVEDGYRWRDEDIQGPIIFVYGRNIRYSGTRSSVSDPGWISR